MRRSWTSFYFQSKKFLTGINIAQISERRLFTYFHKHEKESDSCS